MQQSRNYLVPQILELSKHIFIGTPAFNHKHIFLGTPAFNHKHIFIGTTAFNHKHIFIGTPAFNHKHIFIGTPAFNHKHIFIGTPAFNHKLYLVHTFGIFQPSTVHFFYIIWWASIEERFRCYSCRSTRIHIPWLSITDHRSPQNTIH